MSARSGCAALNQQARLAQLAAELSDRHAACEAALNDAVGHALRAGELLIEAKALVAHGEWQLWLADHFAGSERTARGYMQLAREAERRPVAAGGVRAALAAIAAPLVEEGAEEQPADEEPEVVDAEPVRSAIDEVREVFEALRESGGPEEYEQAMAEEDARRGKKWFPRHGMERTTVRQIRECMKLAQRTLDETTRARGLGDWSCGQGLAAVAAQLQDGAELARELYKVLDRRVKELP